MSVIPFSCHETATRITPLVVDSPHSGAEYPSDFYYVCPLKLLRHTEDFRVDELVAGATLAGAALITARYPRSYIDINRAEDDIDPELLATSWPTLLHPSESTLQGLGLVRRLCRTGVPVYAAPLDPHVVEQRIVNIYRPYHAALGAALQERHKTFGFSFLIDVHSMPDGVDHDGKPRADFVLGDRQGSSCGRPYAGLVAQSLSAMGYHIAYNNPYRGVEIVRRYGEPTQGRHALQLEINRRLYMDESRLQIHDGFVRLQRNLTRLFTEIAAHIENTNFQDLAAE